MNIFQRILAFFGREYILFVFCDNTMRCRHAYVLGNMVFANPYVPDTRTRLLPGGKVNGASYVKYYIPLTKKIAEFCGEVQS